MTQDDNFIIRHGLDSMAETFFVLDLESRQIIWNKAFTREFGYRDEEIAVMMPVDFFVEEDRGRVLEAIRKAEREGSVVVEATAVTKTGTRIPYECTGTLMKDEGGRPIGIVGTGRDITDRKRIEVELQRLASIVQDSFDPINATDREGNVIAWNAASERLYGYSMEEMLGKSISIIIPQVPASEILGNLERVRNGEIIEPFDTVTQSKQGAAINIWATLSPLRDASGTVVGVSAIQRDITDRKRIEVELQRLASIVQDSFDAIVAADLEGTVTAWNAGAERIYGYSQEEMLGKSMLRIKPPDQFNEILHKLETIREGKSIESFETVSLSKQGTEIYLQATLSPIRDATGTVVGVSAIAQDITDSKKSETALKRYASLVEHSFDAIVTTNLEGIITSWNTAAQTIFGYSREEILGKPVSLLKGPDHADEVLHNIERIKQGETIGRYETVSQNKRGDELYLAVTMAPIKDASGSLVGTSGIIRDMTARRKAELKAQMFASIARYSGDAIIGTDLEGTITAWNIGAQRMYGYLEEEVLGKSISILAPPVNRDEVFQDIKEKVNRAEDVIRHETTSVTKDGRQLYVFLAISLVGDMTGSLVGACTIVHDMTARRKAEMELLESKQQLQIANRNLEEANTALKVLLKRRDDDRKEIEKKILLNHEELITPFLEKLKQNNLNEKQKNTYIEILESSLKDITSSFSHSLSSRFLNFTPAEIHISNLLRQGKTNKEIGEILKTSSRAVAFHRENIRKKLGLKNKKTNLKSYLLRYLPYE